MMTLTNDGPKCRKCGDWIEIHDGEPVCKSGCPQKEHHDSCATDIDITLRCTCEREDDWDKRTVRESNLPELDSIEDGPIDGYDY